MFWYYLQNINHVWGTNDESIVPENAIKLTNEQYEEYIYKIENGYDANFEVINNSVIITYSIKENWENIQKEHELNVLRNEREPLLIAFDKYKTNVNYGIAIETEETRKIIIEWYNKMLDLDKTAFNNIPIEIKYYL